MIKRRAGSLILVLGLVAMVSSWFFAHADDAARSSVVRLVEQNGRYILERNGQPFFIKGAGGDGPKDLLKSLGANSYRTWGSDNLGDQLAQAQKLGLGVTVGIWLGHKDQGFNYHDPAAVQAQFNAAQTAVLSYRNSPALLVWGLGNEMETGQEDDPAVYKAIQDIAAMVHKLDPNHPTMTVVAEIGGDKIKHINEYCPDIDIVGINSYAGATTIPQRYRAAGGVKPYIITEFGPPGTWEWGKNGWGAVQEPSSTEKADWYRNAYEKAIDGQPLCLGSYAFTWGNKQEATATWFGMLLADGSRLAAVDTMQKLWSGAEPAHRCPAINSLAVHGPDRVDPGTPVKAVLDAAEPDGTPLKVDWLLQSDPASYHQGGAAEAAPRSFPSAITSAGPGAATVTMPAYGGGYRLFAYVHDHYGGAAVANIPLFVTGDRAAPAAEAPKAPLPLVIYGSGSTGTPFTPSGYMGNAGAIKMDDACRDDPHSGSTCLKAQYMAADNWGGVTWQSPANDWGDKPGGWDLASAKKLVFWARGDQGGEKVSFSFGILKGKTYSDSGSKSLDQIVLTKSWTEYTIDLHGVDLSDIKTGFCWVVAGSGQPVTFYLDDMRYE